MINKDYICISCPMSCDVALTDDNGVLSVTGNACKRGEMYAKSEYTQPVRMLTTTVSLEGSLFPLIPVISSGVIPREKIDDCLKVLYSTKVQAPIKAGDVIVANILETGVDMVSAKSVVSII